MAAEACVSNCVFDGLGWNLAQFLPGPGGAYLELALQIAAFFALVALGLMGRGIERRYAPKHETVTYASFHRSCLFLFPIAGMYAVVMFNCLVTAANVGVQLVMGVVQTLFLLVICLPIGLLCVPLASGSDVPTVRFVRHVQIAKEQRAYAGGLAAMSWKGLCKEKNERDTLLFYLKSFFRLFQNPTPTRWLTFGKALYAVLFDAAWPKLMGLMWCATPPYPPTADQAPILYLSRQLAAPSLRFMLRIFSVATLCVLNPPEFIKQYQDSVRQRKRVALMAYPQFWDSKEYQQFAQDVEEEVKKEEATLKEAAKAKVKAATGLDQLEVKVKDMENKAKDGVKAASGVGELEAAVDKYREDAVKTVSSAASELLWEGGAMPDLFQTVFGYVSDVLGETLFLVIFFVQAAGLAQLALDKHAKEQPRGPSHMAPVTV